ncbi:MAG: PfkB family carbohydrate kinase, partial [Oscillospiraceae bacterium]
IMQSYCTEYGIKLVATTQRIVKSPRKHSFGSVIYDSADGKFYKENPYEDIDVVDRIGSGDAYVAGVLFGLLKYGETQKALEFGNATAAVKNTIPGDLPSSDYKEISAIIASHTAKGPVDELNR